MDVGTKLLAMSKRIAALEIELNALECEKEALDADGDEAGVAQIERRRAELEKQLKEETRTFYKSVEDSVAEAVLSEQVERYWNKQVYDLLQPRCSLLEIWLRFYYEDGVSLLERFVRDCFPILCGVLGNG